MAPKKVKSHDFPEPIANADLVGHTAAQNAFLDAWNQRGRHPIHPVWILSGAKGIGKATCAYRIARFVLRERDANAGGLFDSENDESRISSLALPADDPAFKRMLDGGFGDFFIIDLAHNIDKDGRSKQDAKQISVHAIRAMIEKMQLSSMEGAWRVVIIDSVDEMTAAASNAVLKLLEEPPAQTLFLLIVHSLANTLPTIRSRARVEKLHPLSISELREVARMFLLPEEQDLSPVLLKLASGSFGRIANLKKNGGDELYEKLLDICDPSSRVGAADVMALAGMIAKTDSMTPILLDAAAHFGLADLYTRIAREIAAIDGLHLEPEVAVFKVIAEIRKNIVQREA
ncbi:MAG: hypothetical protein LBK26_03805 [Rickettsiales bacterium]|jgi:DNA polymerase-3 subunit delta'|nr:hypothetical protein [Rickettsiales bacterium]